MPGPRQWENALGIEASSTPAESPAVASDGSGNALMVWRQDDGSGTFDVMARRYTALSGWTPAVTVDTQSGDVKAPRVVMDGLGNAWVVWTQDDGSRYNLWGRRYDRATESWEAAMQLESTDTTFGVDSDAEMAHM